MAILTPRQVRIEQPNDERLAQAFTQISITCDGRSYANAYSGSLRTPIDKLTEEIVMNSIVQTLNRAFLAYPTALLLACARAVSTAYAGDGSRETVTFQDLNVSTPDGVEALYAAHSCSGGARVQPIRPGPQAGRARLHLEIGSRGNQQGECARAHGLLSDQDRWPAGGAHCESVRWVGKARVQQVLALLGASG